MQNHEHSPAPKRGAHSATFQMEAQSRDDLFGFGRVFADILPPALLQDSSQPLCVAVNGDFNSGKKIIPDSMKDRLLGFRAHMIGHREFDERWFGQYKKQRIEVDFLNAAWGWGYSDKELNKPGKIQRIDRLLERRTRPGISFIHNCSEDFTSAADIEIKLTIPVPAVCVSFLTSLAELKHRNAARASAIKNWNRSLELRINDHRLIDNPGFMAACETLSERVAAVRPGKLKGIQNTVTRSFVNGYRNISIVMSLFR